MTIYKGTDAVAHFGTLESSGALACLFLRREICLGWVLAGNGEPLLPFPPGPKTGGDLTNPLTLLGSALHAVSSLRKTREEEPCGAMERRSFARSQELSCVTSHQWQGGGKGGCTALTRLILPANVCFSQGLSHARVRARGPAAQPICEWLIRPAKISAESASFFSEGNPALLHPPSVSPRGGGRQGAVPEPFHRSALRLSPPPVFSGGEVCWEFARWPRALLRTRDSHGE